MEIFPVKQEDIMDKKKWIAYGITGVVGLGVVAGGATAAASSMDLRTQDGTVVPGSTITNGKSVIDGTTVQLRDTGSSISVVTAPTAQSAVSAVSRQSAPSARSVASAASAPAVSKKSSDSSKKATATKKKQYSAPSYSAPSYSAPSRPSPASAPSADSPDSVASAWSD
ncbi:hypothetical protein [Microbacterium sp. NIBRBAC000506063]|uniref:hypothetical protein n=1 Tax=Microbacterium sp. NIBRBAC000506063 TaxID=2734618 RepID=UPI001BB7718E|nr:hypothetical protein [Microbacterium sp. NIBRBAC000506063]QTV79677.1 hypothetical protein KAE78_12865 [Microbacterium sp. NIBRBAC000506063]